VLRHCRLHRHAAAGTVPLWLQTLKRLRVLTLGVQYGSNDDPAVQRPGLYGTIPPLLGKLRMLRELNLDENALTGVFVCCVCRCVGVGAH
jgi:hypothetical protein